MSARVKGAALILDIAGTEYQVDITTWKINNAEKSADVTTFGDVAAGDDLDFFLSGTATQSTATASFWRYIWDNAGAENVAYTVAPHGNAVATADQPHFTGTLTIGDEPEIGVDAGKDNNGTFDFEWKLDGKPTLDTGA